MAKPKKVYVAKSTGRRWNTREEAVRDNARYKNDIEYRLGIKAKNYGVVSPTVSYPIPFIKSKKRTLTNAGLATGAVISENMLDSIAYHAQKVGLPIKTAIGLATKETTLGNGTVDGTFHTLFKKGSYNHRIYRNMYNANGTSKHINPGVAIDERNLVNFHDERNPYKEAYEYADKKSANAIPQKEWYSNIGSAMVKSRAIRINMLNKGETYADKQAKELKNVQKTHVLDAAFNRFKNNPNSYNPGQQNYKQLVNKRAEEVWRSPEIQNWYKTYRKRSLEEGGK